MIGKLLVFVFVFISINVSALENDGGQDEMSTFEKELFKNRRKKHPLGVNAGILGPTGWGYVSVDYFVASKINFEGGIGIQTNGINPTSLFFGAKYHLGARFLGGITPYFGVVDAFFWKDGDFYQHNLYFPIGLHKIKRDKWSWGIEMAYQLNKYANSNIWGSIKIGYRIL